VSWLDARYDRYIATGVGGVTTDVAGHRLVNAPLWSGRIWTEWTAQLSRAHMLSLRADWIGQTTVYYTAFNTSVERQSPYALLGLSSEFGPSDRLWSISAFARNVTNRDYITGTFGTPVTAIGARPGEPRQLGAQFTMRR
jgi:iron complex outermembrane receptor protein